MRPKAYLLPSLRLLVWKSESFVFFVIESGVRMKLFFCKICSQTHQNSPAWNEKATEQKALLDGSIKEKQV